MHGFCTVGFFVGIPCIGCDCFEMRGKCGHRDGWFACGGYSLRAGGFGLGIEAAFKLLAQLHTGGLLDMGVGVHQPIALA